mmetsp:Transcript_126530/g.405046  ORF Transcript_126530/g.405046 Transcript_126530/m.405046 type:complete len:124 (-) Transcript_126530:345-716(-)
MSGPSWKHDFKAHRIAANQGHIGANFIYHKEAESFPLPLQRPQRGAARPKPPNLVVRSWRKFVDRLLPGGANGGVGAALGFGFPFVGVFVLVSFIYSQTSDQRKQLANVQSALEYGKPEGRSV